MREAGGFQPAQLINSNINTLPLMVVYCERAPRKHMALLPLKQLLYTEIASSRPSPWPPSSHLTLVALQVIHPEGAVGCSPAQQEAGVRPVGPHPSGGLQKVAQMPVVKEEPPGHGVALELGALPVRH